MLRLLAQNPASFPETIRVSRRVLRQHCDSSGSIGCCHMAGLCDSSGGGKAGPALCECWVRQQRR
jgi:hypothetical protein